MYIYLDGLLLHNYLQKIIDDFAKNYTQQV